MEMGSESRWSDLELVSSDGSYSCNPDPFYSDLFYSCPDTITEEVTCGLLVYGP